MNKFSIVLLVLSTAISVGCGGSGASSSSSSHSVVIKSSSSNSSSSQSAQEQESSISSSVSSSDSSSSTSSIAAPTIVQLFGTVSTGNPVENGTVSAACVNGPGFEEPVKTNASGNFTAYIYDSSFPCLLQVSGGDTDVVLHSYAARSGIVNITPLTDLMMGFYLRELPSVQFSALSDNLEETILDQAQKELLDRLEVIGYLINHHEDTRAITSRLFDDVYRNALHDLAGSIVYSEATPTYNDLLNKVIDEGSFTSFPLNIGDELSASICFNQALYVPGTVIDTHHRHRNISDEDEFFNVLKTEVGYPIWMNGLGVIPVKTYTVDTYPVQKLLEGEHTTTMELIEYFQVFDNAFQINLVGERVTYEIRRLRNGSLIMEFKVQIIPDGFYKTIFSYAMKRGDIQVESYDVKQKYVSQYPDRVDTRFYSTPYERTLKFLGIELVTVPAGTFSACVFEERFLYSNSSSNLYKYWYDVESGIKIKKIENEKNISEAVSVSVNGFSVL